ncbi:acetyl-CoA acetyltransferase-like [Humulus lupulus]|uniref:acetyl-CoA acetyltransferase-like n=1 Tax=Humulus lupulus TaxID=3486 RepID=UPI002B40A59D|nr:acetyl-CoA acetyltransferase-like [Humulus lupulus]
MPGSAKIRNSSEAADNFKNDSDKEDEYRQRILGHSRINFFLWANVNEVIVGSGCPNLLRKAINSAKRLRAYVRLDEGDFAHKDCIQEWCNKKGNTTCEICLHFDATKLRKLRPSFKQNEGSVTAGNASIISCISPSEWREGTLTWIATQRRLSSQAPKFFTTAPALVIPKAISNAGLDASQIDYYEINEEFSVVALANQKLLGLNPLCSREGADVVMLSGETAHGK